jgi:hypothetical protein
MKKVLIYLFLAFLAVSFYGCFPKDANTYSGPTMVEFKNHTFGVASTVLNARGIVTAPASQTQTDSTRYILINTRVVDTIYVQLVGAQQSSPIAVNFSVRATNTAIEGTHYNFTPNGNRTVTIPANSSVGYLLINPIANSIPVVGDTRVLAIDLVGGAGITASPNYNRFILTLKR